MPGGETVTKLNVFIKHGPTGIEGHIELDGEMTKEDYGRFLGNVAHTFTYLAENGFEPSRQVHSDSPKAQPATDVPSCPDCGGEMWDNRTTKKNPRGPDLKCKDPECAKAVWLTPPPKKEAK
jgi:hypothetical protein